MPKARNKRFNKKVESRQSQASNPFHNATKLEIINQKLQEPGLSRGKRKRLEREKDWQQTFFRFWFFTFISHPIPGF